MKYRKTIYSDDLLSQIEPEIDHDARMERYTPDSRVSPHTRDLLRKQGRHPQHISVDKYRKPRFQGSKKLNPEQNKTIPIAVSLDYSSLQYFGVVRHYIQANFDVKISELELLLYLFPLGLWSLEDYEFFPHRFSTRTIRSFYERGYIEELFEDRILDPQEKVFKLSASAKRIVQHFYKYLHQEMLMPENAMSNSLFRFDASAREQKKAKAIAEMNRKLSGKFTKEHKSLVKRIQKRVSSDENKEAAKKYEHITKKAQKEKRLKEIKAAILAKDAQRER